MTVKVDRQQKQKRFGLAELRARSVGAVRFAHSRAGHLPQAPGFEREQNQRHDLQRGKYAADGQRHRLGVPVKITNNNGCHQFFFICESPLQKSRNPPRLRSSDSKPVASQRNFGTLRDFDVSGPSVRRLT
ncbi:MAG: hypothetical protein AB7U82_31150 [Blastocatellales bacterium]